MTPAHLVTIVADAKLGDWDVKCTCGWLGGSWLFNDQAERARDKHYRDAIAAGLSKEHAQAIHGHLADILAAANMIRRRSQDAVIAVSARGIIEKVVKLSAEIPAPEKESHE